MDRAKDSKNRIRKNSYVIFRHMVSSNNVCIAVVKTNTLKIKSNTEPLNNRANVNWKADGRHRPIHKYCQSQTAHTPKHIMLTIHYFRALLLRLPGLQLIDVAIFPVFIQE